MFRNINKSQSVMVPFESHHDEPILPIDTEKETREERLIRIRYQQILKQEERERKKKDK